MRADPAAVHAPCMARRAWTCPRMSMLEHGPPACEQSTRGRTFALPGLIIASVKTDERPRLQALCLHADLARAQRAAAALQE